jgi:hypothetical protein
MLARGKGHLIVCSRISCKRHSGDKAGTDAWNLGEIKEALPKIRIQCRKEPDGHRDRFDVHAGSRSKQKERFQIPAQEDEVIAIEPFCTRRGGFCKGLGSPLIFRVESRQALRMPDTGRDRAGSRKVREAAVRQDVGSVAMSSLKVELQKDLTSGKTRSTDTSR